MGGVVDFVSGALNAVGNVISSVVNAVVNVAADVINFVASPFMGLLGQQGNVPNAQQENQRQEGVLIQRQGSRVAIPVVYGYRKVAGSIVFAETGSTQNQYLWVAYVFSEGLVEGINDLWIDDFQISETVIQNLNAGQTVDVADGKYADRVQFQWYPGVFFANPASSSVGTKSICKDAPSWKPTMVYNGLAVLFARYYWKEIKTQDDANANPFSGSIPKIEIGLLGKRVASLRSTGFDANYTATGTSGAENYEYGASGYTERYSTNPAEIVLDYLRNPRYGKGLKNSDLDWNSFFIAAYKCNTPIEYTTGVRGPILTLNYVVDTNSTLFSNIKVLLQNMRGYLPYVQGQYRLKIEDAGNPLDINSGQAVIAATFGKDNIVGSIQYTAIDRTSKYNWVTINWVSPDDKWSVQQVVYPENEAQRQTYIDLDGGRENSLDMTLGAITNSQIAKDMARLVFNKSRFQESCTFSASAQAFDLEPGDNVRIRSNILNFADVPWRVVSLKLNDDYTFEVACVRNPDFIYPYVRPNTPDFVLPPYVPIGGTILPPTAPVGQPVGLYPPVTAPLPGGVTTPINTSTNPPTTITTGTQGGGVGGSTSTQNTTPVSAPMPSKPLTLDDIVSIDTAEYQYLSNDTVYITFSFKQPLNAAYKSLLAWIKPQNPIVTNWSLYEITELPGSGNTITYKIGPVPSGTAYRTYDIRTRVTYRSGELSTRVGKATFATDGTLTQDPADSAEVVTPGWSLNTIPPAGRRDDNFEDITGIPQLTAGNPRNPRELTIRLRQNTTKPANPDIVGVKVYYKLTANTYWDETEFTWSDGTYTPGSSVLIDFTSKGYLGAPASDQQYSFIFRWRYIDNTYSSYQVRYNAVNVESTLGVYSANPFYAAMPVTELTSSFSFSTVAQGIQSGVIATPIKMTLGLVSVKALTNGQIRFAFNPPHSSALSYWRGVRILYRPVDPGANPQYTTFDSLSTSLDTSSQNVVILNNEYDRLYEYVIVPLVYQSSARVNGENAWYGKASIHNTVTRSGYPSNGEWLLATSWSQTTTSQALGQITTGFAPADPTIVISQFKTISDRALNSNGYVDRTTDWGVHVYYRLGFKISHISSFTELHIFRRSNNGNPLAYDAVKNPQSYGLGPWEKIVLPVANCLGSGLETVVNLRAPISYQNITTTQITAPTTSTVYRTIGGVVGLRQIEQPKSTDEFIFLVKTSSGFSTKALYYRGSAPDFVTQVYDIRLYRGLPTTIDWPNTTYDSPSAAGYQKTFAEAIFGGNATTSLPFNRLWITYGVPTISGTTVTKSLAWFTPGTDTTGLGVL